MSLTAALFPGQGSHRPGMATAWEGHPAHATFDEVGRTIGLDLVRLADDAETCATTAVAQPVVYAASIAAWRALTDAGVTVDVTAGHSLGEVAACVAAGSLSIADGAQLVTERGRAMGRACRGSRGGMVAVIGLDAAAVGRLHDWLDGPGRDATIANDNAPGQVVLAGPHDALERAEAHAVRLGGRCRALTVEGAFHTTAMSPAMVAVHEVARRLTFAPPTLTWLRGRDAAAVPDGAGAARALVEGVLAPVNWRGVQTELVERGVTHAIEVGPGGVLRGLAKRAMPDVTVATLDGREALDALGIDLTDRPHQADRDRPEVPAWA
ncbi:MAG TPA: ACP S-malonyltransferase [Nitriliruptorales bacterium]